MEKDLLTGLLTKAYNKTSEEISELLYTKPEDSDEVILREDALDLVLGLDEKRVERLKSSIEPDKETLRQINDRALVAIAEDFEKKLKAKYGVKSSSKGLDLVQEIIDQVSECDISDEKVKQHPLYLELEGLKSKEDYETLRKEYDDFKSNQDRLTRFSKVETNILSIFSELNPIESQNPTVARNHRADLLRKFEPYDYELKDDGNHLIIQNGNRIEDKHGNPVKFYDFTKSLISDNYDLAKGDDRGNAGNTGGGNSPGANVDVPKDEKEYLTKMADFMQRGDKAGAIALQEAWKVMKNK